MPLEIRLCRAVLAAALASAAPVCGAAGGGLSLATGYERVDEQAAAATGLGDAHRQYAVVRGLLDAKAQQRAWDLDLDAGGEAGQSVEGASRFADLTVKPSAQRLAPGQAHRLELVLTAFYDAGGLVRRPLTEQADAAFLTPATRQRSTYLAVNTDHYVELTPRDRLVVYTSSSVLGQGVQTRTYVAGGFVEHQLTPRWRLRVGATGLRLFYDRRGLASAGPELAALYLPAPGLELTLRSGLQEVADDAGRTRTSDGGAALGYELGDVKARAAWARSVSSQGGPDLTATDTATVALRRQLGRRHAVELGGEQRHEDRLRGTGATGAGDAVSGTLRHVYSVGEATWRPDRSALNVVTAYVTEQLTANGARMARQVLSVGCERVL